MKNTFERVGYMLTITTEYDQFTIDWMEAKREVFCHNPPTSESEQQTLLNALRYEVENILEIMKEDSKGKPFFDALCEVLSASATEAAPLWFPRTRWA